VTSGADLDRSLMPEDALYRLVSWAIDEVEPVVGEHDTDAVHAARAIVPTSTADLLVSAGHH
jgi:hypothetical protein